MREEIVTTLNGRKVLTLEDRCNLPYTEATLMEVQRLADVTPLGMWESLIFDFVMVKKEVLLS